MKARRSHDSFLFCRSYLTHSMRSSPSVLAPDGGALYLGIPQNCGSSAYAASAQFIASSPGAGASGPPPAHQSPRGHMSSLVSHHPQAAHLHPLLHSPGLLAVGYLASAASLQSHLDARDFDSPFNLGRPDFGQPRVRNH